MYKILIRTSTADQVDLELETMNRNNARVVMLVCKENKLVCEVTEEVKPRVVKFKGID